MDVGIFHGFVSLGSTIKVAMQTRNTSDVPLNADAAPRRQVYGVGAVLTAAAGQASQMHTGTVTGATNASPIVITSASHGLETGTRVTITGVGGNTAANGTFTITKVDANSFSLDGSTGNGAYTSGGTWNVAGLYVQSINATAGNGFAVGNVYHVYSTWAISTSARSQLDSFVIV